VDTFCAAPFAAVYDRHFVPDLDGIADKIRCYAESAGVGVGTDEKCMLDLCCGTGHVIAHFARNGYRAVGIDGSPAMLELARSLNSASIDAGKVSLMAADATGFTLDEQVDLVTCTCDSLNHLESLDQLRRCFAAVRRSLRDGGLIIFDLHSTFGLSSQNIVSMRDLPDLLLTTKVLFEPSSGRVFARVVGFHKLGNANTWERFEQNGSNTAWPAEQICSALTHAGFEKSWPARLADLGLLINDPDQSPRIFFVARG
jgi:SAM-dependent methyltransferase